MRELATVLFRSPNRALNWSNSFKPYLLLFFCMIMFAKYVYDHINNDVWIIRLGILGRSDH